MLIIHDNHSSNVLCLFYVVEQGSPTFRPSPLLGCSVLATRLRELCVGTSGPVCIVGASPIPSAARALAALFVVHTWLQPCLRHSCTCGSVCAWTRKDAFRSLSLWAINPERLGTSVVEQSKDQFVFLTNVLHGIVLFLGQIILMQAPVPFPRYVGIILLCFATTLIDRNR